jgi:hypothetical protein
VRPNLFSFNLPHVVWQLDWSQLPDQFPDDGKVVIVMYSEVPGGDDTSVVSNRLVRHCQSLHCSPQPTPEEALLSSLVVEAAVFVNVCRQHKCYGPFSAIIMPEAA